MRNGPNAEQVQLVLVFVPKTELLGEQRARKKIYFAAHLLTASARMTHSTARASGGEVLEALPWAVILGLITSQIEYLFGKA